MFQDDDLGKIPTLLKDRSFLIEVIKAYPHFIVTLTCSQNKSDQGGYKDDVELFTIVASQNHGLLNNASTRVQEDPKILRLIANLPEGPTDAELDRAADRLVSMRNIPIVSELALMNLYPALRNLIRIKAEARIAELRPRLIL
jgi:hypothetical protein